MNSTPPQSTWTVTDIPDHTLIPKIQIRKTLPHELPQEGSPVVSPKSPILAKEIIEEASRQMISRGQLRDQPEGERSMANIVKTFNALTGRDLTEQEGWEFMIVLKLVRGRQGKFNADDYIDAAAYSALLGESEATRIR